MSGRSNRVVSWKFSVKCLGYEVIRNDCKDSLLLIDFVILIIFPLWLPFPSPSLAVSLWMVLFDITHSSS